MLHEMRGQYVDVELVGANVRIVLGHGAEALVPIGHGDRNAVRFRRRGHVLFRPLARDLEGVFQDAVGADAREDRLLDRHFSRTTMKSMSPMLRPESGERMPGISRTGRTLAY